jgi:uncharacterized LabA/DUF88 family protein
MKQYDRKRYGLFIDGSNLYASAKALGFRVDFSKIHSHFSGMGDVAHAMYFTALPPKTVESPLRRMVDFVEYNEFTLVSKETHTHYDADNTPRLKGNMDVEIAVYMEEVAGTLTDIVLFSGDGDFRCLVESVQRRFGVHVTVISTRSLVSDALRRQANKYIDLSILKDKFIHQADVAQVSEEVKEKRRRFLFGKGE